MKTESFCLNAENFSDMRKEFESQLSRLKIEQKDILRTKLLLEEIFSAWSTKATPRKSTFKSQKIFSAKFKFGCRQKACLTIRSSKFPIGKTTTKTKIISA